MQPTKANNTGGWLGIATVVVVAAIVSAFYGVNEYAGGTSAIVKSANNNSGRFEAIFRDLVQARYRALNIAAETMLQSRVTTTAFAKEDRAALSAIIEPFFATLRKDHGIEQLNFWQAPAKVFYRAGKPDEFGMDLSVFRKSIVAATERRQRISAIETGAGGVIALRAIAPVMVEDKFVGVLEFVSNFDIPLERASETSGLKWAVSLSKEVSDRVERPADTKVDAWHGTDVYYRYSDPVTAQTVKTIAFDARAKEHSLASADGRTYFVKTFPVVNFSGVATITIATVLDLTQQFADVLRTTLIKSSILFLVTSILGCVALVKFSQLKGQFGGAMARQKKEFAALSATNEAMAAKLKDMDVIKRGFFTNLITAVNAPLQAVSGQLKVLPSAIEAAGVSPEITARLNFAVTETTRLSRLIEDYQQVEMFRQKLVKTDCPLVHLSQIISKAMDEDLRIYQRLPQLKLSNTVSAELPPTRANADLLRRAVSRLVGYAAQRAGKGEITLSATQDEAQWLVLNITGSAFAGAGAPTEALLDESRQFIARLGTVDNDGSASAGDSAAQISVVLARLIIEFYGGSLSISQNTNAPGFVVRLAAAHATSVASPQI